jgi:hypothetical protein
VAVGAPERPEQLAYGRFHEQIERDWLGRCVI